MIELQIIKHLLNKDLYNKYISFITPPEELKKHYKVLEDLHSSLDTVTLDDYILHAEQQGCDFLDTLKDSEASEESLEKLIKTLAERTWAHRLAVLSIEVSEGRKDASELSEHYDSLESILDTQVDDEFVTDDIMELWNSVRRDGGLQWRLPWLNETIGGLRSGDFGFIFARTNVGKTTFLCSEVSNFLKQVDKPILWMNNEEGGGRIKFRLLQSYFGISSKELESDLQGWMKKFLTETQGRFKLKDSGAMHKRDVERLVKSLEPSLLIIDNIDKVHGFKGDRQDLMLGNIYIWGREIAKDFCPLIGVSQANGNAENKKWLTHTDIKDAHTSKSSEGDFILGIGMTYDNGCEDIRFLRQVKNKFLHGDHKLECRLNYDIGRYESL